VAQPGNQNVLLCQAQPRWEWWMGRTWEAARGHTMIEIVRLNENPYSLGTRQENLHEALGEYKWMWPLFWI
jgi:hypothetical protein